MYVESEFLSCQLHNLTLVTGHIYEVPNSHLLLGNYMIHFKKLNRFLCPKLTITNFVFIAYLQNSFLLPPFKIIAISVNSLIPATFLQMWSRIYFV